MAIKTNVSGNNQDTLTILIDGVFNFHQRKEFKDAYVDSAIANGQIRKIIVDLSLTSYIDSSGLGMLLILKEHSDNANIGVSIINANDKVKELLELSNFKQIFDIT